MEEDIFVEANFGIGATVASDYGWDISAWEDDYAIFNRWISFGDLLKQQYLRVHWSSKSFMAYDEQGKLIWIDRDMTEMIEIMFSLRQ